MKINSLSTARPVESTRSGKQGRWLERKETTKRVPQFHAHLTKPKEEQFLVTTLYLLESGWFILDL